MNIALLQKVKEAILAHPKQVNMDWWHARRLNPELEDSSDGITIDINECLDECLEKNCGTVHCIAGWTELLVAKEDPSNPVLTAWSCTEQRAAHLLDLEQAQWKDLFFLSNWPWEIQKAYKLATTADEKAAAVANCIDKFIKEGGWEWE